MGENLTDVQRRQDNVDKTWALLRSANTGVINSRHQMKAVLH